MTFSDSTLKNHLILATITMMIAAIPAFAVGTVNQSLAQIPQSTGFVFTENWTGDASTGSVPATVMLGTAPIQGFRIVSVEIAPGSPAPTNNYTVTVTDFSGADLLGGTGATLSSTVATILPSLSNAPPLFGSLTVNVTGNSVASAQGRILVYFAPVSQVIGNTPTGASLTGNNLFTGANTFQGTSSFPGTVTGPTTFTGATTLLSINNVQNCDQFAGATPDVKIAACIAALPSTGGVANAQGFTGAQAPAATIPVGTSTKPVELILNPSSTWTCSGTSACFDLSSTGSELQGYGAILTGTNLGNHIKAGNSTRAVIANVRLQGTLAGSAPLGFAIDVSGAANLQMFGVSFEQTPAVNSFDGSNPNFTAFAYGPSLLVNTPGVGQFNAQNMVFQHFTGAVTTPGTVGYFEVCYGAPTLSSVGSASGVAVNAVACRNGASTNQIFAVSAAAVEYSGATGGPATGYEQDLKNSTGTDATADASTGAMGDFNQRGLLIASTGSNLGGIGNWIRSNNIGPGNWQTGAWIQDWNTSGLSISTGSAGFPFRVLSGDAGTTPHVNINTIDNNGNVIMNTPGASGNFVRMQGNLGTTTNWLIGCQFNVNNGCEITPSTVVGGTTFNAPVFETLTTGAAIPANLPFQWFEGTAPAGQPGRDLCYGDSTAHNIKCNYNNVGFSNLPLVGIANTWAGNQSFNSGTLLPSAAGGTDLGSTALPFGNLWLGTAATNNFKFAPAATTAARVISIPDPGVNTNLALNLTATSSAFATATTAGTCVQQVTAVAGAATTMVASASPVSTPGVGAVWSAFVSSAGNVTINECAVATSAGGTIAFNIRVTP